MFPKVRSADHFWSAKLSNLVRKAKTNYQLVLKIIVLSKKLLDLSIFITSEIYFMVRRVIFQKIMWSAIILLYVFKVRNLKKFGKHWSIYPLLTQNLLRTVSINSYTIGIIRQFLLISCVTLRTFVPMPPSITTWSLIPWSPTFQKLA